MVKVEIYVFHREEVLLLKNVYRSATSLKTKTTIFIALCYHFLLISLALLKEKYNIQCQQEFSETGIFIPSHSVIMAIIILKAI